MPYSADLTQVAIIKEVTYGVTPATPAFQVLPVISESLTPNASSRQSSSLSSNRQVLDSILTGIDVSGSIEIEFSKSPALTVLLESAMGSETISATTNRDIFVGNEQISYTVEVRFEDADNPGTYKYHRYTGCVTNTASINMTAGDAVTASFGIIGKAAATDTAIISGATYTEPTLDVFSGPDVGSIVLDNAGNTLATALTGACVTDINININNNYRGVQCLGVLGNSKVVIGKFECTYDQTIYFGHNQLMDDFLAQTLVDEEITIGVDSTDNHYKFTATKGKISSNAVVASGQGADVTNAHTITWLYDSAAGTPTALQIHTAEGL